MPLGVEDMRIPDSAFTASGSYDNRHGPSLARLNLLTDGKHMAAWCPKIKSSNQWLQINLGEITAVTKVATQGRYNSEDRVKTYKLSYSVDGIHWTWYKQRAVDKVIKIDSKGYRIQEAKVYSSSKKTTISSQLWTGAEWRAQVKSINQLIQKINHH